MQPTIRHKKVHTPAFQAGEIDEGNGYLPKVLAYEFTTSGSGYDDFLYVPPGTFIEKAVLFVKEALDTGALLDLGTDGNEDALIDNTDVTEDAVGAVNTSTTAPNGLYFEDGDMLRLTVGNDNSQGVVVVYLWLWNFLEVATQGYHDEITIS